MFKVFPVTRFVWAEYNYLGVENNIHIQLPLAMGKSNDRPMGDLVVEKNP